MVEIAPNPALPAPIVLDYQRTEKAKHDIVIALIIWAAILIIVGVTITICTIAMPTPKMPPWCCYGLSILMVLWGIAYILLSLRIYRGLRWAAWLALALASLKAAAWFAVGIGIIPLLLEQLSDPRTTDRFEAFVMGVLWSGIMTLAVALIMDVWLALRTPQIWRA